MSTFALFVTPLIACPWRAGGGWAALPSSGAAARRGDSGAAEPTARHGGLTGEQGITGGHHLGSRRLVILVK